jgi:hypothetical protein
VGGAQRNHLARQIRRIRKQKGMYAIHYLQMLSHFSSYLTFHEFSTVPKDQKITAFKVA